MAPTRGESVLRSVQRIILTAALIERKFHKLRDAETITKAAMRHHYAEQERHRMEGDIAPQPG